MFFIIEILGCLPYVQVILDPDESGGSISFDTKKKAERYAKKNCSWEYQIVEFN